MQATCSKDPAGAGPPPARRSLRSAIIRQVTLWHWVSSGVCLGGMLLFTVTGITLNHASSIPAKPLVETRDFTAPPAVRAAVRPGPGNEKEGRRPLPPVIGEWLVGAVGAAGDGMGEWSADEVYISLPRPGGDAWLTLDRATGGAHYEVTDRGWISYCNDLHKGRHTGQSWSIYIDVLAVACLVFSITGLILLQTHAAKRPATWPLVAASVVLPLAVLLLAVHR